MLRTGPLVFAQALLFASAGYAGNSPDFSGTWKSDRARSDSAHQATPIGPITLIVSQTASDITVETKTRPKDREVIANEKLRYNLDGSETRIPGRSGTPIVCRARWDGPVMILETMRNINGATVTTNWRLSMDARGKELTIKKTLTVQHGYESLDPKNVGTGTDIFVRTGN